MLVLAAGAAQALPPPRDGDIRALYWELRNETEVWLTLEPKSPDGNSAPQAMTLTLTRRFTGKWPGKQPPRFEIRADAGFLWAPRNELWMAIDGEKVDFASRNPYGPVTGEASTYVAADMPVDMLATAAKAARLSGNALGFEFELTASQRQAVRDFYERAMSDNPARLPRENGSAGRHVDSTSRAGLRSQRTRKETGMVKVALLVRLEAKPGKEAEVESFLRSGLPIVQDEPATIAWFGIRLGPSTFGIFDAFPDDAGRQAHLSGRVAAALMAKAGELLSKPPVIEKVDVLAVKLPA